MIECPRNGGEKIKLKKRASYLREGQRDEHNRGAGRDSSRLITMGLLLETVEDVTWRNRGKQRGIQREEDKKRIEGACESLSLEVDRGTCVYVCMKDSKSEKDRWSKHLLSSPMSRGSGKLATKSST